MRLHFFFFIAVVLCGCGGSAHTVDFVTHAYDSELDGLYGEFVALAASYGKDVKAIQVSLVTGTVHRDDGEPAGGVCERGFPLSRVAVDEGTWVKLPDEQRRALIFHELGHCVLEREHREDTNELGCPKSMMSGFLPSVPCLGRYQKEYDRELFTGE